MVGLFGKNRKPLGIIIFLFCVAGILFPIFAIESDKKAYARSGVSASIVMNADTMEIIKGENYNVPLPMASTTKIMTALLVAENCLPTETVVITKEAVGVEGSSIYLKEGECLTVKDLLYGLMLRSGNDAAVALALHAAGSVEKFVEMMNLRAESLNLNDTHYDNPHGLESKTHYTSCKDLCTLGCIAMKNSLFREIVGTKQTRIGENESLRDIKNKNRILFEYDGGNGIKTGYTNAAGRCLVSAAERNGVQIVAAVLNTPDMFGACENMMNYAFDTLRLRK